MAKHHPDLIMCRKLPGIAIGRLCEKCAFRPAALPPAHPASSALARSRAALACAQATARASSATLTYDRRRSCASATSATTAPTPAAASSAAASASQTPTTAKSARCWRRTCVARRARGWSGCPDLGPAAERRLPQDRELGQRQDRPVLREKEVRRAPAGRSRLLPLRLPAHSARLQVRLQKAIAGLGRVVRGPLLLHRACARRPLASAKRRRRGGPRAHRARLPSRRAAAAYREQSYRLGTLALSARPLAACGLRGDEMLSIEIGFLLVDLCRWQHCACLALDSAERALRRLARRRRGACSQRVVEQGQLFQQRSCQSLAHRRPICSLQRARRDCDIQLAVLNSGP